MALNPILAQYRRNLPRAAKLMGFSARVTSGYRSYAAQARLYKRYLAGLQPYPVAPPGYSDHEKGLALDIVSTNTEKLVQLMQALGLEWAGPADPVHFSLKIATGSPRTQKVEPPKAPATPSAARTAWDLYKEQAPAFNESTDNFIKNWLGISW